MTGDLGKLRIDKSRRATADPPRWAARWIVTGVALLVLLGVGRFVYARFNPVLEVETVRVRAADAGDPASGQEIVLNATGYIIAAHKIQLASKVLGRVAWIGVEKGDKVKEGQVIVRLEDDEYRAQLQQARGNLLSLQARLAELEHGSRPEEIQRARAELDQTRADLANARTVLARTQRLVGEGVLARQALDDARARHDSLAARVQALDRSYELVRLGPRQEQIAAVKGQLEQARGAVAFFESQLSNTVIRAPVTGTILERAVEKGEFVTTSFVGERGAKGYVVSLADLSDLRAELDINQNDFAKLRPRQPARVTTDAFPDRVYDGVLEEISPEANRQKATVQVKVRILKPDDYLRPEMNASVAFYNERAEPPAASSSRVLYVPASSLRGGYVFVVHEGRALRRAVRTGGLTSRGLRVDSGLIGGEDLIVNPPEDLKDGAKVKPRSTGAASARRLVSVQSLVPDHA